MDNNCIFCKIIAGKIPCDKVYEDEHAIAFKDIKPVAPVHILIVPKKHVASLNDLTTVDLKMMPHLFHVVQQVATQTGVATTGYRTIINTGRESGQEVFHLHVHIIGGKRCGAMG